MKHNDEVAEREREHFDRLADEVGEAGTHRTTVAGIRRMRRRGRMIAKLLKEKQDPYALEIGAGAGAFSQFILEEAPELRLLVCDISPKCIDIAREKLSPKYQRASFEVADCTKLDHKDNTFDLVCGCSILHHLPLESTLAESFRILKPGGCIWFSEPNMMNPQIVIQKNVPFIKKWLEDTEDETAFFRWPMIRKLRAAGFQEISVRPFDFLHPSVPRPLVGFTEAFGQVIERIPVFNEIAGSLVIVGRKLAG